jgi:undecaprenyl-diphosphatase
VLAGAARMPYGTFLLYNALGAVCWAVVFGTLGYLFARSLPQLEHYIGQASLAGVLLLALIVGLALGWRWFETNRARLVERTQLLSQRVLRTPGLKKMKERYPRAWTFVAARFARGEYLGLHLTIGFAASLAGLWLFGGITEDVIHHDPLTQFDVTLLNWLHARATPAGYALSNAISLFASPVTLTALALGGALLLAGRRQWILLGGWLAAFAGGGLLDAVLKVVIRRPRPPYAAAFLHDYSWSFPSGHAMGSLVSYGMLAYMLVVLWIHRRSTQVSVLLGAALLILAVGISRLYLGVHYFSDVVGGYAAGLLWLAACISGLEVARRWPPGALPATPGPSDGIQ